MALLFQVLVLPVALHLNSLGGPDFVDLHEDVSLCPATWQAAGQRLCNKDALQRIADANIHRQAIEGFLVQPWAFPGLESSTRALASAVITAYDMLVAWALDQGCLYAHGFALLVSALRVHFLILIAGVVQDICGCVLFCVRKTLLRLLAPLTEAFSLMAGLCSRSRRERPVVPRKVLSVAPVPLNASAVRRRTRQALEALAESTQALAKAGLTPEDMALHAAELHYAQERCHPMRESEHGEWWLPEGVQLEVPRLRLSDSLRLLGLLLPLPCTVQLLEETLPIPLQGPLLGACGIFCAAASGLLSEGHQAWPTALLALLRALLAALGAWSASYAALSAALLASVDLRRLDHRGRRSRAQLAAVFGAAHVVSIFKSQVWDMEEATLAWTTLADGYFCDAKYGNLLGLPLGALAILLAAQGGSLLVISSMLTAVAWALLMHTGRSGLVAALWWLTACEAISAAQCQVQPEWLKPATHVERKARDMRIASRKRGSSNPARSGGA